MSCRARVFTSVVCFVMLSTAATSALADDKPAEPAKPTKAATDEARERFKRGVDLFRDGDYRAALIEFNRANEVVPNTKLQFNIAQTCLELQDYACALRAFETYLGEGGADIPKARRQFSERELERVRRLVGHVRVKSNKDGADVTVDDAPVGRTPITAPLLVGAGRHKITVALTPLAPVTRTVDIAGGDSVDVTLDFSETPSVVATTAPSASRTDNEARVELPPRAEASPQPARSSRAPFWIGLTTTGVLAAGSAVAGILTLSAKSDLDSTAGRFPVSADELGSARSRVQTASTVTDILLVSTVVSAGLTTLLYFTTAPSSRAAAASPRRPASFTSGTF
jgi:hypothetical protein